MHILMISEFFPSYTDPVFSGGVEVRCYHIAKRMARQHKVTIFARRKTGEVSFEEHDNLSIYRYGSEVNRTAATILSIFPRLYYIFSCIKNSYKISAEVVEGSNFITYLPTFVIAKLKNIPAVAYYPDVLLGRWRSLFGFVLGSLGHIAESFFIKLPWSAYIVTANAVRDRLKPYVKNKSTINLIPCGIEKTKANLKNDREKKLLVVSRLVSYKRVDWVIRLLAQLRDGFKNYRLVIIGSGPEELELKKMADNLGLNSCVQFKHNITQKEIEAEYKTTQLLIHPSLIEGFGIVLVEANSYGVPFVAADIPTSVELVEKLKGGLVFEKDKFDDLFNKVELLLGNDQKRAQLSEKGLSNVKQYEWDVLAIETEKLFQKLVSKNYDR